MILGITVLVHFIGYLLTGLPLFSYHYKNPGSLLWKPIPGVFSGALLGMLIVIVLFGEGRLTFQPPVFLVGVAYGTFTALAALRQRPARH